jgi:hypothetical protein
MIDEKFLERVVVLEQRINELEKDRTKDESLLADIDTKIQKIEKKLDGQVSFVAGVSAAISLILFMLSSMGEKAFAALQRIFS